MPFSAGFVVLAVAAGLSYGEQVETLEESFPVSGRPQIHVRNEDGRTELSTHGESTVAVRAVKEVVGASSTEEAERLAGEVEVRIEQRGDRIEVETRHPEREWSSWREARVLVHLQIRAPARSDLDVVTEDGRLTATGFEGSHRLTTEDGDVTVTDCSGSLDLTAEDGDVILGGFRGALSAEVDDGDLEIEGSLTALRAESEDGDMEVRLAADSRMTEDWSLRASDGTIRLELPPDFTADLDVRTNDGSIRIDLPVTTTSNVSEGRLVTSLNGGGHRLAIRTEDGSVRLTRS